MINWTGDGKFIMSLHRMTRQVWKQLSGVVFPNHSLVCCVDNGQWKATRFAGVAVVLSSRLPSWHHIFIANLLNFILHCTDFERLVNLLLLWYEFWIRFRYKKKSDNNYQQNVDRTKLASGPILSRIVKRFTYDWIRRNLNSMNARTAFNGVITGCIQESENISAHCADKRISR